VVVAWWVQRNRDRPSPFTLPKFVVAFLAGVSAPYGVRMLAYPFLSVPPDVGQLTVYLPLAGAVVLWGSYNALRQIILEPVPAEPTQKIDPKAVKRSK